MPKTITQRVVFRNVAVATLYDTYLDPRKHSASIGAAVKIQKREGTKFSSHDGYAYGRNLQLVKNKLIVQSWRAGDWSKTDTDSTFILCFEQKGKDGVIHMVHANVPDNQFANLKKGWFEYYWKPWKKYFSEKGK